MTIDGFGRTFADSIVNRYDLDIITIVVRSSENAANNKLRTYGCIVAMSVA